MNIDNLRQFIDNWLPLGIMLTVIIQDMKFKSFDLVPCLMMSLINLCWEIKVVPFECNSFIHFVGIMLMGGLPGLIAGCISSITGNWIGEGDCMLLILIGMFRGECFMLAMILFAFLGIFIMAVILLSTKNLKFGMTIPMVPYLTVGYILSQWYLYG